jgi:hypothetical protein
MPADAVSTLPAPLLALAASQGGAFTRQQAFDHEVLVATLERLRRRGTLLGVRRGTYALASPPDPDGDGAQTSQRQRSNLRATAAAHVLRTPGDVVISHEWAAAVHGWHGSARSPTSRT